MDILKSIEFVWSLIVANIFFILVIAFLAVYLFKTKKRQTYLFYYKNIRKPIGAVHEAISTSLKDKEPSTPEQMFIYHNSAFNVSDTWSDPYTNTSLLSNVQKKSFCTKKMEEIRKRIGGYYAYTNGRIKPLDLFELVIYKQELDKS